MRHCLHRLLTHSVAAVALVLSCLTSPVGAQAPQLDMRDAFVAAIRSPDGRYRGQLDGLFAAYARQTLKTDSAIFVDITTVARYARADCKRVRALITAPDLRWTDASGAGRSFEYGYEMSVCLDGSPPNELALEAMKSLPARDR
jgi:hypothetical protein